MHLHQVAWDFAICRQRPILFGAHCADCCCSNRKSSTQRRLLVSSFWRARSRGSLNIVTVALLATAGLRGGQILEASSSTCSASHSLLPSASAAPQGFKTV